MICGEVISHSRLLPDLEVSTTSKRAGRRRVQICTGCGSAGGGHSSRHTPNLVSSSEDAKREASEDGSRVLLRAVKINTIAFVGIQGHSHLGRWLEGDGDGGPHVPWRIRLAS